MWKQALFCGIENISPLFSDTDALMQFIESCIDSACPSQGSEDEIIQVCINRTASAAVFHCLCGSQDLLTPSQMESIQSKLTQLLCQTEPTKGVIFCCYCLKAILSSCKSYLICQSFTNALLPHMWATLGTNKDKSNSKQCTVAKMRIGHALQFIVSDSKGEGDMFWDQMGSTAWSTPIWRQRAFCLCLDVVLRSLDNEDDKTKPLLALGWIVQGAGEGHLIQSASFTRCCRAHEGGKQKDTAMDAGLDCKASS